MGSKHLDGVVSAAPTVEYKYVNVEIDYARTT